MAYKIDLFAIFIFLGIVQAMFLSLFFFSKENRRIEANVYQGLMVVAMSACTLEILLCYTGYIQTCLWLVDFSESLAFVIGPAFYLMVVSMVQGKTLKSRYFHFIVPLIWLLLQIPYFLQGDDVKFNAWIGAYHPAGLSFREVREHFFNPPYHTEFILAHLTFYTVMGFVVTFRAFRLKKEPIWKTRQPTFLKLRTSVVEIIIVTAMIFVVKLLHRGDTGDHLFAAYITVSIYLMSFQVIRESGFFKQPSISEPQKYKRSSVTPVQQQQLLDRLKEIMTANKPFLKSDFSLPELADQMRISVHQLSQIINDGLGKSFFEMTAEYRIEQAKILLKTKTNIKVEEIAEEVGYNSKSSFNTAFKKITGKTPGEWRS